jgi:hypothetical protein
MTPYEFITEAGSVATRCLGCATPSFSYEILQAELEIATLFVSGQRQRDCIEAQLPVDITP